MKSLKLKKLVSVALVAMAITAVFPVGASAEWKQDSNGWWNTEGNSWSTGWRSLGGSWYYFNSDGYMKTGWVNDGGKWYFMQPSGSMKTGWISDGGKWYFAEPSGSMKTGWVNDGGKWYYTAASGAMQTGWVNDGGTWYFTAASGDMQTGVVEVEGKVYYLAPSGAMATGTVNIDGVTYTFAASGEAIGDKLPTPTISFSPAGVVVKAPAKTDDTTPTTTTGSSGGGSSSSSSTETFQKEINRIYGKYASVKINKHTGTSNFDIEFLNTVDSSVGGKVDYVTQDVLVTNAIGTDVGITKNNDGSYTAPSGSIVYSTVRVYRNGQIGYVTIPNVVV